MLSIYRIKKIIKNRLGIDQAVAWILFHRIWSMLTGALSVFFIVRFLTVEQQGIWYTFGSLAALSIFAELGFTIIITQFVSHEYANLKYKNGFIIGSKHDVDKLFSLIRYAIKFYFIVIPIAIIVLTSVGYFFFRELSFQILIAWTIFSVTGGIKLFTSLLQSIYMGLDKVVEVQKNVILGAMLTPFINWILLFFGFNIWALVVANFTGLIIMVFLLYRMAPNFWWQVYSHKLSHEFNWLNEIISLQYKYAISWISGYLIFQLYVPAAYKIEGPILAGQMGLTFTIINVLLSTSTAWVDSKIPKFNILVATGRRQELVQLFFRMSSQGYISYILGAVVLLIIFYFLKVNQFYDERFLDYKLVTLLLLTQLAGIKINFMAKFLRAHKMEPYYWLSVLNAILITISTLFIFPRFGVTMLFISMVIINWLIILPIAYLLFMSVKNRIEARFNNPNDY